MPKYQAVLAFTAVVLLTALLPLRAVRIEQDGNYSLYDNVLQSYVSGDGLVDYAGLRANSAKDLEEALAAMAQADLRKMDYSEKLCFWINAYNAHLVQLIATHPEADKITDHPDFFDTAFPVAKGSYSLNDIEHRVLRGKPNPKSGLGAIPGVTLEVFDPRVHFALNHGSIGGPQLQSFAYNSKNLEDSLRKNSSDFVNSPRYLRAQKGRLIVSRVMNQNADDFVKWGGPAGYLTRMVSVSSRPDAAELKRLLQTDYAKAEFVYDPTINDILHAETKRPKLMRAAK